MLKIVFNSILVKHIQYTIHCMTLVKLVSVHKSENSQYNMCIIIINSTYWKLHSSRWELPLTPDSSVILHVDNMHGK